jgi:hypothetical protein
MMSLMMLAHEAGLFDTFWSEMAVEFMVITGVAPYLLIFGGSDAIVLIGIALAYVGPTFAMLRILEKSRRNYAERETSESVPYIRGSCPKFTILVLDSSSTGAKTA